MAAILGMRGTGQFASDHRAQNWREKWLMLEPNGAAPLTAILSMLRSERTDDPVYHNFRKDLPNYVMTESGTLASEVGPSTLTVSSASDATYFRIGMLIRNWRSGEVAKITAKPSTVTFTITRHIGGSGAGPAGANLDTWFFLGNANEEGGDTPEAISHDAVSNENYTQIFREPIKVSRTAMKTNFRTGDQYAEKARDALKQHMIGMERAMLWGKKGSITGSLHGEPERYTGGIIPFLTTNVLDVSGGSYSGVLTESEFDAFLAENVFAFGSSQKLALVGWQVADSLQKLAKNRWTIQNAGPGDSYGISMTRYNTFAGELVVKTHPQFRQIPGAEQMMLILDTKDLMYRFIDDTQLLKDRQSPGIDGVVDEYLTECGLEMLQEKTHALISGWADIS